MVTLSLVAVQALSMGLLLAPALVEVPVQKTAPPPVASAAALPSAASSCAVASAFVALSQGAARALGEVERVLRTKERPELRPDLPGGLGYGAISQRTMTFLSGNVPLPRKRDGKKPYLLSVDASWSSAKLQLAGQF